MLIAALFHFALCDQALSVFVVLPDPPIYYLDYLFEANVDSGGFLKRPKQFISVKAGTLNWVRAAQVCRLFVLHFSNSFFPMAGSVKIRSGTGHGRVFYAPSASALTSC